MMSDRQTHGYSSRDDLQSVLVGRWMLCNPGTPNAYWSAAGVGLDLLASGRSYPLFRVSGTQIVRGGGYVWHYTLLPTDRENFDMVFEGGGNPTFHAHLEAGPRKLVLNDGQKDYTFAPAQ